MSIFDNEKTISDLSEMECIEYALTNVPDEHKPIYSLIWYDIFHKYLLNDNISFSQKVRVYYAFTKYPVRWKIDVYTNTINFALTKPLPVVQLFSNEYCTDISNEKSYMNILFKGMFEASESAKRYNEILDFYGDPMNYWKNILENICSMFICTRPTSMSDKYKSMFDFGLEDVSNHIHNDLGYHILDKHDNIICVENPLEVWNKYLMYVYKALDYCGVEINKEYS